jgi:hypothetical protein
MVDIVAATGTTVTVPDEAINVVSGPYHSDSGTKSYVRGNFGPGALESKEDASHLVGRLRVTLAMLTRPNGTRVWVKTRCSTAAATWPRRSRPFLLCQRTACAAHSCGRRVSISYT